MVSLDPALVELDNNLRCPSQALEQADFTVRGTEIFGEILLPEFPWESDPLQSEVLPCLIGNVVNLAEGSP